MSRESKESKGREISSKDSKRENTHAVGQTTLTYDGTIAPIVDAQP